MGCGYIDRYCEKCINRSGYSCNIYKEDTILSINKCEKDGFKHCVDMSDTVDISDIKTSKLKQSGRFDLNVLTIELTDGSSSTWKDDQWDDWDLIGDFLVIMDDIGRWVGMRNKSMIKKVDMYHE